VDERQLSDVEEIDGPPRPTRRPVRPWRDRGRYIRQTLSLVEWPEYGDPYDRYRELTPEYRSWLTERLGAEWDLLYTPDGRRRWRLTKSRRKRDHFWRSTPEFTGEHFLPWMVVDLYAMTPSKHVPLLTPGRELVVGQHVTVYDSEWRAWSAVVASTPYPGEAIVQVEHEWEG